MIDHQLNIAQTLLAHLGPHYAQTQDNTALEVRRSCQQIVLHHSSLDSSLRSASE